jgi:O-acetyl-ADP-ribose deacetylase (regulator of RNase III)
LAAEKGLATVAFPAISTGVYGYPRDEAAAVSSRAIKEFLATHAGPLEVRLVFFSAADVQVFVTHQNFGGQRLEVGKEP